MRIHLHMCFIIQALMKQVVEVSGQFLYSLISPDKIVSSFTFRHIQRGLSTPGEYSCLGTPVQLLLMPPLKENKINY